MCDMISRPYFARPGFRSSRNRLSDEDWAVFPRWTHLQQWGRPAAASWMSAVCKYQQPSSSRHTDREVFRLVLQMRWDHFGLFSSPAGRTEPEPVDTSVTAYGDTVWCSSVSTWCHRNKSLCIDHHNSGTVSASLLLILLLLSALFTFQSMNPENNQQWKEPWYPWKHPGADPVFKTRCWPVFTASVQTALSILDPSLG